jgi:hypothetical protein
MNGLHTLGKYERRNSVGKQADTTGCKAYLTVNAATAVFSVA